MKYIPENIKIIIETTAVRSMVRLPILWLISDVVGNSTTITAGSYNNSILYCKCGMDHSDPYAKRANTDCRTIQYDAESQGIDG